VIRIGGGSQELGENRPPAFRSVFTLNSASYHWMSLPRLETWHPGSHSARDENSRAS